MLGLGRLDGKDVCGPGKALRSPAPGDRFLKLVPVGLGEGAVEAKWYATSPLPSPTALRNARLFDSVQRDSAGPDGVSL